MTMRYDGGRFLMGASGNPNGCQPGLHLGSLLKSVLESGGAFFRFRGKISLRVWRI